jgi:hypothetical protein
MHGLLALAVAAVAAAVPFGRVRLVAQMRRHLPLQRALEQALLHLLEQPMLAQNVLRIATASQQFIQQYILPILTGHSILLFNEVHRLTSYTVLFTPSKKSLFALPIKSVECGKNYINLVFELVHFISDPEIILNGPHSADLMFNPSALKRSMGKKAK